MPDRASVFETVQIGLETTPGTSVAANKRLLSMSIEPSISANVDTFQPKGMKFDTVAALGKEWTQAKVGGKATYTDIIYALASVLKKVTPTSAGTTGKLWTFTTDSSGADVVASYTCETGSGTRAGKFTFGQFTEFGINYSRDAVNVSGSMMGQQYQDNITLTASPTDIDIIPVLPSQVSVYLADTYAGLAGASAMTRALEAGWNIGNRFGPVWALDASKTSYAGVVETDPTMSAKLKVAADAEGMALLTTMRTGASKFMRIKATGALIETSHFYTLQIDMCGKVSAPSEFSDQDGLFAIEWTLNGAHDSTWGKAVEIQVKNMIAAL